MGLVLRAVILNVSFEYDELFTAVSTNPALPLSYVWQHFLVVDVHPPFYNIGVWVYNHAVPYGPEWVLRLPSLLCGVLILWEGWQFFPRYLGRTARMLFLVLLSCNFYLIMYAQHARAYSLLVALAIPFTFFYLRMSRVVYHRHVIAGRLWVAYGLLGLLLCWSHYFGALCFGVFSVVLFSCAWYCKQRLRWFIVIPVLVLLCFTPWLLPNLLENIALHRFTGNWWGNTHLVSWNLVREWIEFFFSSSYGFYVLAGLVTGAICYNLYGRVFHAKKWPYCRDILVLFIPLATVIIFTLAVSGKIFWLIWRYFMPFMPSLYLCVALLLTPVCRRYKIILIVFFIFAGISFVMFFRACGAFQKDRIFAARGAMQIYQTAFGDKDLYVVALEGFPLQSLQPMYSFYPNHYFHMKQQVYELYSMPVDKRKELLKQSKNALMWMPNCELYKKDRIEQQWKQRFLIFAAFGDSCFLVPALENQNPEDEAQMSDYTKRFTEYEIQKNQRIQWPEKEGVKNKLLGWIRKISN